MDIYITDLAAYNAGHLVGAWHILPMSETELTKVIEEVLSKGAEACGDSEPNEEYFITDYESEILIDEYDDIFRLNELAELMQLYTDDDFLELRVLSSEGYDERDVIDEGIEKHNVEIHDYRNNSSFTDTFELLAQDFVNDGLFGEIPTSLENYIDYEAIARDLRFDYSEVEINVIARVA